MTGGVFPDGGVLLIETRQIPQGDAPTGDCNYFALLSFVSQ
jgi:hypothetical protein